MPYSIGTVQQTIRVVRNSMSSFMLSRNSQYWHTHTFLALCILESLEEQATQMSRLICSKMYQHLTSGCFSKMFRVLGFYFSPWMSICTQDGGMRRTTGALLASWTPHQHTPGQDQTSGAFQRGCNSGSVRPRLATSSADTECNDGVSPHISTATSGTPWRIQWRHRGRRTGDERRGRMLERDG